MSVVGAFVLWNLTEVVPVKFVPVTTTVVPTGPLAGEKLEIVGAGTVTVKLATLLAVPPGVVAAIGPVAAAEGAVAVIWVEELTAKVALAPLNVTEVAPVRFVPVITTLVPAGPLLGEKPAIVGAAITVKLLALLAVPP